MYEVLYRHDGEAQMVYDYFLKGRNPIQKNGLPAINEVKMSRLKYIPPSRATHVTIVGKTSTFSMSAISPNFGVYACQHPGFGAVNNPPIPNNLVFTSVDPKVATYLLQRAYSKMSTAQFDFGITLGEVAETAAFLAKPLMGIAKLSSLAFMGCKAIYKDGVKTSILISKDATKKQARRLMQSTVRHPIHSSLRIIDETANHWLAYKFGVLPIIDDIAKAQLFADENIKRMLGIQLARVRGPKSDTTTLDIMTNRQYANFYFDGVRTVRRIDQHSCGLYFRNKVTAPLVNFVENLGFAPWHLPSLAYELIPLSFVVDRFLDIKSFVRGNIGSLTKETYGHWCTRKVTNVYAASLGNLRALTTSSANRVSASAPLAGQIHHEMMARVPYITRATFPVINPYWKSQLVSDMTNLSLIWGRLRSRVGKLM